VRRETRSEPFRRQITVRLCSGLGNQLFQFACGLAQSRRWQASLNFDTTWYTLVARIHTPLRHLRLHKMGLPVTEAFTGWRRWMIGVAAAAFDRTGRGRSSLERTGQMAVIQETKPLQQQSWPDLAPAKHAYLNGYWQTADHFLAVRDEMQGMINPTAPMSSGAQEWRSRIAGGQTGFIHIRRGDYASLVGDAGLLPLTYYKEAIKSFQTTEWHWLVFSEDEEWARHNMRFISSWELVTYQSQNRDVEDLQLMALCHAGIIANSSYSWWGAALGDRPGRPVCAPNRYWNRVGADVADWALPSWRTVDGWSTGQ
jgi:hypothetical protein